MAKGWNGSQASSQTHESLPGTMRCEAAVPIAIEVKLNSSHCGFSRLILHSSLNQAWKLDSHWETINDKTKMERVFGRREREISVMQYEQSDSWKSPQNSRESLLPTSNTLLTPFSTLNVFAISYWT